MKEKLLNYGFHDWQVKELLKKKILKTIHGTYKIKNDKMYLTKGSETKEVII